jgi:diguanylate cyclase (GGDEF)-like protein
MLPIDPWKVKFGEQLRGPLSAVEAATLGEGILDFKEMWIVIAFLRKQAAGRKERPQGLLLATAAPTREKQQKFGILDSPNQLTADLQEVAGPLGRAVIFLDIDHFKELNSQLTNTRVDALILPAVHQLFHDCALRVGYAYCVGGDEFAFLLPNSGERLAIAFAEELRARILALRFDGRAQEVHLTVSIGMAHGTGVENGEALLERANEAEVRAKANGRDRVEVWGFGA